MRKIFPGSVTGFLVAVIACGSGVAEEAEAPPVDSRFEAGQVWSYHNREGEDQSRVYVAKVERLGDTATVVHIQIVRVAVESRFQPSGFQDMIPHAAIGEEALEASVEELKDEVITPVGFADAYASWHQTLDAGTASYFTISVAEILDMVERAVK